MSGSSLDGLDFAICTFEYSLEAADFSVRNWRIEAATTDPFPPAWRARLEMAPHLPGRELWRLHADLGHWIGQRAAAFLADYSGPAPTLVGSHGHTVFHDPSWQFTTQIGDGAAIAHALGLPTVTELRGADVAAGGQGAPLAPVADKYLFPDYPAFLNLGGIANLSVRTASGDYVAGDISGCCQILDRLARLEGRAYDDGGGLARSGRFQPALAEAIGALPYHAAAYPKSLGNDWVVETLWPVLRGFDCSAVDKLNTFTKWLAVKIAADLEEMGEVAGAEIGGESKVLVTGGGAKNGFLLEQLNRAGSQSGRYTFGSQELTVTDFKEAALIALCALLRIEAQPNSLPSATNATRPTVNGALYLPPPSIVD